MIHERTCGILMPVSALPSEEGIGTFGRGAYRFLDFLARAKQRLWQVLPLTPTGYGDSPYQSCSSVALNYYLIDLDLLTEEGLLTEEERRSADLGGGERIDYEKQFRNKIPLLKLAFSRFDRKTEDFCAFAKGGEYADFALFMALKERFSYAAWTEWDARFRIYNEETVRVFAEEHEDEIAFWLFTQYIALRQWNAVRDYAHAKGIRIMGDIPLYVAYDSVEMWKYGAELFRTDELRVPEAVAGCPPDAFSESGQLWGNPVYNWKRMEEDGYAWWNARIRANFRLFDILRIDHFRGFDRYYAVPYGAPDARIGSWEDGPKEKLFADKLSASIVAEDLGIIDDGVRRLMKNVGYPGMKVASFAFDGDPRNEHKPSNYAENIVAYTGTHDNMPFGGYLAELGEGERRALLFEIASECKKLGVTPRLSSDRDAVRTVVRLLHASRANTVVVPLWDALALGEDARINHPSTVTGRNWTRRFSEEALSPALARFLRRLAEKYGR